jgi:N-sulfoglucosamine sulfohydrolase
MKRIALLLLTLCGRLHAADKMDRPNLLFFFADDWGRYAHAYAAFDKTPSLNQILKTPHLDRLAKEGALFRNAFVTSPSCTPCRSSLLSGQYFFRTHLGAILNGAQWDPQIPSYPLLLKGAGYHIGKSYKVWSPGTPADAPYGSQTHAFEAAGRDYNNFSENASELVRKGAFFDQARDQLLTEVRQNFRAFLDSRTGSTPFCYWFGPTLTHRAFEKGSGHALWGIQPDTLKGKLPPFLPDVPEVRADVADYMGEIQAWDAGIGVILEELDSRGELDKTVVFASGDHGMPGVPGGKCNLYDHGTQVALLARGPGIAPGRVLEDFVNLMDLAPTFLELGGVPPPEVMTGKSLVPILYSNASGQVDPTRTWVVTGRERHVADARENSLPYPQRALRTRDFLYIRNFAPERWPLGSPKFSSRTELPSLEDLEKNTFAAFADMDASPTKAWLVHQFGLPEWDWVYQYAFGKRPGEELFDLRKDPDGIRNVSSDPHYAAVLSELSAQLTETLQNARDPRVLETPPRFELPPFTAPGTNRK